MFLRAGFGPINNFMSAISALLGYRAQENGDRYIAKPVGTPGGCRFHRHFINMITRILTSFH